MAAGQQERIVERCRPVEVEHARNPARLRRLADRRDEIRIAVVEQHRVDVGDCCVRDAPARLSSNPGRGAWRSFFLRRHRPGSATPTRSHPARAWRRCNRYFRASGFARMRPANSSSFGAERARKAHLAAKAGDGNRGISGLTSGRDQEFGRLNLGAGIGKLVDPHDDVLHGAAGAQDAGMIFSRMRVTQSGSRPPPMRG